MALVRACGTSDVAPGTMKYFTLTGKDILIANLAGKFFAMDNWCTHEEGNLSKGQLKGNIVTCPEHEAQFDVGTGKVVGGPEGEKPESISSEKSYTVLVQGTDVMVEIP